MSQSKIRILVAAPIDLFPGCPVNPTQECMDFFAQDDNVEVFQSMNVSDVENCDAVVIPGGLPDVDPVFYGEVNTACHSVDTEMDKVQFAMIERTFKLKKPAFSMCRGHQLVAVYLGATLFQDIAAGEDHCYEPGAPRFHDIYGVPGSRMYDAYGAVVKGNSGHHQALKKLPECLKITQFWCKDPAKADEYRKKIQAGEIVDGSDDLVIEAVEHRSYPYIGLQWHPEMGGEMFCENVDLVAVRKIFYKMIAEAQEKT